MKELKERKTLAGRPGKRVTKLEVLKTNPTFQHIVTVCPSNINLNSNCHKYSTLYTMKELLNFKNIFPLTTNSTLKFYIVLYQKNLYSSIFFYLNKDIINNS